MPEEAPALVKRRKNHIWLNSEISNEVLTEFQEALHDVGAYEGYLEESYTPVTVHLHSEGGDMFASLAIYDLLQAYPGEVTTVIEGYVASGAAVIFMAGGSKRRYVRPSGFMLIHPISMWMHGKHQDIKNTVKMLDMAAARIHSIFHVKTGQTSDRVGQWLSEETWLNQEMLTAYNVAELLTSQY